DELDDRVAVRRVVVRAGVRGQLARGMRVRDALGQPVGFGLLRLLVRGLFDEQIDLVPVARRRGVEDFVEQRVAQGDYAVAAPDVRHRHYPRVALRQQRDL